MPAQTVAIGPFASIFVADAPNGPFIELTTVTTGDQRVLSATSEVFLYAKNNTIQDGPRTVSAEITFLGDDLYVNQLAAGNSLMQTLVPDASSSFQNYSVLLIDNNPDTPTSVYIPTCHTIKKYEITKSKRASSQLTITFGHQEIDRSGQLYYKRDVATLKAILGIRSPF